MDDKPRFSLAGSDVESTVDLEPLQVEKTFSDEAIRRPCLMFLNGPLMGQTTSLSEESLVIGRAGTVDIVVSDSGVSRRHARFYVDEDDVVVEDLHSSNGVYVNGKRIEGSCRLQPGDKISLSTTTILKFTYHDELDEVFQQRLLDAAIRDPLSGLYNRAFFNQTLHAEFSYAQRHDNSLALILFDVDHFKRVNDTYGHLAGDALLEQLGALLAEAVREEDFLARFGGEEFGMLCRGLRTGQAAKAAERLRKLVERHRFEHAGVTHKVTLSAGVAAYPDVGADSPDKLIASADKALYRAKEAGRNQTCRA